MPSVSYSLSTLELLKLCSNLASCITSSQSMESRETPCKPVPSAVVRCLKPTKDLDLRLAAFNNNSLKMDFEKIPGLHVSQCKKPYGAYY